MIGLGTRILIFSKELSLEEMTRNSEADSSKALFISSAVKELISYVEQPESSEWSIFIGLDLMTLSGVCGELYTMELVCVGAVAWYSAFSDNCSKWSLLARSSLSTASINHMVRAKRGTLVGNTCGMVQSLLSSWWQHLLYVKIQYLMWTPRVRPKQ